jgi:hypothetical protein
LNEGLDGIVTAAYSYNEAANLEAQSMRRQGSGETWL